MWRLLLAFVAAIGCSDPAAAPLAPGTGGAAPAAPASTTAANPFAAHALAPEHQSWLEGSVEETLAAGSYVYVRLRSPEAADVWVASLAATVPTGPLERVVVLVLGRAERFHSKRLKRDFSPLAFGMIRAVGSDRLQRSKGTEP